MVERVTPVPGMQLELGKKIVEWTKDNAKLPELDADGFVTDVPAFRAAMAHLVDIPASVTNIRFVIPKTDDEGNFTYFIRLPLKELVESSEDQLAEVEQRVDDGEPIGNSAYPGLEFYQDFLSLDQNVRPYGDMLYRRIADYTFAHCK